jgi:Glycosyltransferase
MKVALISAHSFLNPGGVQSHVLGLYKEFKKSGIETKIIVPRRKRNENYGKDVILLGTSFPLEFAGAMGDFDVYFNVFSLEKTLEKEKFDVLHFHNFGVPAFLQILLSSKIEKALKILTLHSNIEGSKFLKKYPFFLDVFLKICQWKIDGIIVVAPFLLNFLKKYKGKKEVIPNGIDLEKFNPKIPPALSFPEKKSTSFLLEE